MRRGDRQGHMPSPVVSWHIVSGARGAESRGYPQLVICLVRGEGHGDRVLQLGFIGVTRLQVRGGEVRVSNQATLCRPLCPRSCHNSNRWLDICPKIVMMYPCVCFWEQ